MPLSTVEKELKEAEFYTQMSIILQANGFDEDARIYERASQITNAKAQVLAEVHATHKRFEEKHGHALGDLPIDNRGAKGYGRN